MATIPAQPLVLKDALLTIGTDDFQKAVSSVTIVPSTSTVQWRGLEPDAVFTDVTPATWAVTIEYAQDWEEEDSLSMRLFEAQGESLPLTFAPQKGTGNRKFSVNAVIVPGTIGGAVGTYATASVTLPCDKPVPSTISA